MPSSRCTSRPAERIGPELYVGWSDAVAAVLPAPYRGQNAYRFAPPNYREETDLPTIPGTTVTWLVVAASADPDPVEPVQATFAKGDRGPALRVTLALNPNSMRVWAVDSDVDLDKLDPVVVEVTAASLEIVLYLNELGPYGNPWDINPDFRLSITVVGVPLPQLDHRPTGGEDQQRRARDRQDACPAVCERLLRRPAASCRAAGHELQRRRRHPHRLIPRPGNPCAAGARECPPAVAASNLASKVDHVVVVMMENRSSTTCSAT